MPNVNRKTGPKNIKKRLNTIESWQRGRREEAGKGIQAHRKRRYQKKNKKKNKKKDKEEKEGRKKRGGRRVLKGAVAGGPFGALLSGSPGAWKRSMTRWRRAGQRTAKQIGRVGGSGWGRWGQWVTVRRWVRAATTFMLPKREKCADFLYTVVQAQINVTRGLASVAAFIIISILSLFLLYRLQLDNVPSSQS